MTDDFETMPDFLGDLEEDLRRRATAQRWRRAAWWPPVPVALTPPTWARPAGLVLATALGLAVVLLPDSLSRDPSAAYAEPPLLKVAPIPVDLGGSGGEKMTQARPFTVLGKRAMLLSGSGMWCLSLPHRNPGELLDVPAVACVRSAAFFRYGVTLLIGRTFVVVLPGGVRAPTLKHANGRKTTLHPNDLGVVAVRELKPGETVTQYGTNGRPRYAARIPGS